MVSVRSAEVSSPHELQRACTPFKPLPEWLCFLLCTRQPPDHLSPQTEHPPLDLHDQDPLRPALRSPLPPPPHYVPFYFLAT